MALQLAPLADTGAPPLVHATAERVLARSGGEVKKPETLNYRTLKPEVGGLFCEVILGAEPEERRARFGHIVLPAPVLHPWLEPVVARALGWSPAQVEHVRDLERFVDPQTFALVDLGDRDLRDVLFGGRALEAALASVGADIPLITALPVLPPGLRPLVELGEGRYATSHVNDLYRRVMNRANRLRRLMELDAPDIILVNEERMLGEAVRALFHNEAQPQRVTGPDGTMLLSLGAAALEKLRAHEDARPFLEAMLLVEDDQGL